MTKTAAQLAKILYLDDMSRADEVPIEPDGHRAYDQWRRSSGEAGDEQTIADLASIDCDEFAAAWEALVEARS